MVSAILFGLALVGVAALGALAARLPSALRRIGVSTPDRAFVVRDLRDHAFRPVAMSDAAFRPINQQPIGRASRHVRCPICRQVKEPHVHA